MSIHEPSHVFVLDQGSRPGPPLVNNPHIAIVIDHHFAAEDDFPSGSEHVSACNSPPVATSSLLTYEICKPLHPEVSQTCDWLCIVGTHGDLGNTLKWQPPFPDMTTTMKRHTKKTLNEIVSLINAPRRTSTYDVHSAWNALSSDEPSNILKNPRLKSARLEVNSEVERCTHTAPKFSLDGKVAVFRIKSQAQVHPVIATRWAGHLQSKNLEMVLVANDGYLDGGGKVNFSCRVARCARSKEPKVDVIKLLKAYADDGEKPNLLERMGEDFARGHVQASGGIVGVEEFEELMERMQVGVKKKGSSNDGNDNRSPSKMNKKGGIDPGQKNNLLTYFNKKPAE